jgi:glycosyltransferase involved in cell wall biosynthesis
MKREYETAKTPSFPGGFAVLMALYAGDKAELFKLAVHSVFENTVIPDQFLIVVDGPIPSLLQLTICDLTVYYPQIEFIYLPDNNGLANALNVGIGLVKFEWIVRADADDVNLPNRFASLAKACIKSPEIQLLGSFVLEVDENRRPLAIRDLPCNENAIRKFAKARNPFNHMTVAYRKTAVLNCGGYPNIFLKEDYALWCHFLAKKYPVINLNVVLVHATAGIAMYRRRGGLRYAKSEWQMQKILIKCGLKNTFRAVFDGTCRAGFFLIPSQVRGWIYLHGLRKRAQ